MGQRGGEAERVGWQKKIVVIGLSTEQQVIWLLTTGNKKKFNIDYAVF